MHRTLVPHARPVRSLGLGLRVLGVGLRFHVLVGVGFSGVEFGFQIKIEAVG